MSRAYDTPPDTSEPEKAIGGYLTFSQFGWLIGGAVLALLTYLLIFSITRLAILSIVFAFPCALLGLPFAFYKKYKMTYFKYLLTNRKFKLKTKKLKNQKIGE